MPNSLYCFMFYLFLSTEEQIKDTVYFFTKDIPEEIRKHMPHRYFLDLRKLYFRNRFVAALLVPAIRKIKYPELFRSEIFGLDFNWWLLREDGVCRRLPERVGYMGKEQSLRTVYVV